MKNKERMCLMILLVNIYLVIDIIILRFVLNTSVELPHEESAITGIVFQPFTQLDDETQKDPCCVTIGEDKRFRIWNVVDTSNIYGKKFKS